MYSSNKKTYPPRLLSNRKKWDIIDSPHGSLCHKADIGIIAGVTHSHIPIGLCNGVK